MSLDSIVNVAIDAQTTSPTRKGFGTPLIAGYHDHWVDSRTRVYTSLLGMIADGFVTTDAIYKAARAVFAQNPRPQQIMVGRFTVAATMTLELTPVVQNLHPYLVTINGAPFTFTSDASATAAEIVDGLVALINAGAEPVTASNAADVLRLVADVAGDLFDVAIDYRDFDRQDITTDAADVEQQLIDISIENDTWYGLVLVDGGAAAIANAAAYIETVKKVAIFVSGDSDILDSVATTDIASVLQTATYARSAVLFSRNPHEWSNAAWEGNQLPNDPGSSTWKFKTLAGISADVFTETEANTLIAKGANFYQEIAGVSITQNGNTAGGEFIDVTIFVDWLSARIQERIYGILVNVKKIPFTDPGIALIEAAILAQLREGVNVGGLVDDDVLQVIVPAAADVSPANKAARILTPVTFQGTLAGAVHALVINGTVTV